MAVVLGLAHTHSLDQGEIHIAGSADQLGYTLRAGQVRDIAVPAGEPIEVHARPAHTKWRVQHEPRRTVAQLTRVDVTGEAATVVGRASGDGLAGVVGAQEQPRNADTDRGRGKEGEIVGGVALAPVVAV